MGLGLGITPARAGNRLVTLKPHCAKKDHPRACGEQLGDDAVDAGVVGSPPRVRGTGCFRATKYTRVRITPARAGNRLRRLRQRQG